MERKSRTGGKNGKRRDPYVDLVALASTGNQRPTLPRVVQKRLIGLEPEGFRLVVPAIQAPLTTAWPAKRVNQRGERGADGVPDQYCHSRLTSRSRRFAASRAVRNFAECLRARLTFRVSSVTICSELLSCSRL